MARPTRLTVEIIIDAVAKGYSVTPQRILSRERTACVSEARQVVMLLLNENLGYTTVRIGEILGRGHVVVIYGLRRIRDLISIDKDTQRHISKIKSALNI